MSELTHAELMARLRAGEKDAQTDAYNRYVQDVIRAARRHLRSKVRAKVGSDAVANSVLHSFFAHHTAEDIDLSDEQNLWPLLLKITLRHCEKWNKRFRAAKRNTVEVSLVVGSQSAGESPNDIDLPDHGASPEEAVMLADFIEHVLNHVSPLQQRIFELRREGQTIKQIADEVGMSQATINRNLREIYKLLDEYKPHD